MIDPVFLIALDRASRVEREAVHEAVKSHVHPRAWWHRFADLWIVGGGESVEEWRDVVSEALAIVHAAMTDEDGEPPRKTASVLVFNLPPYSERDWASLAARERVEWLHKYV
jgi:hypothetical protein